ncbi:sensor histidine kinase [Kitasatospora sp. NPDC057512]|uniref:sensor histidine kinase n=1 Tax=Kitasatospora sp. NPDC057512 TaxID=3346154 RepID=UPI0036B15605
MHNRPAACPPAVAREGVDARRTRLMPSALAGLALLSALLTDLGRWWGMRPGPVGDALFLGSGAAMGALVLWALRPRASGRAGTAPAAAGALLVSFAASAGYHLLPSGHRPTGLTEGLALALLLSLVAHRCRPPVVAGTALAAFAALLAAAGREGGPYDVDNALLVLVLLGPGLLLRWRAERRAWHIERAVREERNALARDLHDVVAHQVTGIVVQAQALQYVAVRDPELLRTALADIEHAGADALAAMRRLVGALREGEHPAQDTDSPARQLAALARPGEGHRCGITVSGEAELENTPAEVAAALLRIAQEAVTNADRHARGATRITVRVHGDDGWLHLDVHDDGRGPVRAPAGDGYGLIGMAERAKLLGGTFRAGPAAPGTGWHVAARLPGGTGAPGRPAPAATGRAVAR